MNKRNRPTEGSGEENVSNLNLKQLRAFIKQNELGVKTKGMSTEEVRKAVLKHLEGTQRLIASKEQPKRQKTQELGHVCPKQEIFDVGADLIGEDRTIDSNM
jgi:hypothetical protein